jgi:lysophospholipase L1-like esterase
MTDRFIQYVLLRLPQRGPKTTRQPRRTWLLVVWICAMTACPSVLAGSGSTLLVLGDSISAAYGIQREQGWVEHLSERLHALSTPGRS